MQDCDMSELKYRRFSLPPISPSVLYCGKDEEFGDFEYPSVSRRGKSLFSSLVRDEVISRRRCYSSENVRRIAAPLLVAHSAPKKLSKRKKKRKKVVKKKVISRSDAVVDRLYKLHKNDDSNIKTVRLNYSNNNNNNKSNSRFFTSKNVRYQKRTQLNVTKKQINFCDGTRSSLPSINGNGLTPLCQSVRKGRRFSVTQGTNRVKKYAKSPTPVQVKSTIRAPNYDQCSLFYTPIKLRFPDGYHFNDQQLHNSHSERITKHLIMKLTTVYEQRFLTHFSLSRRNDRTVESLPDLNDKFGETIVDNLDFAGYQKKYRNIRFQRSIERVRSLSERNKRRKIVVRLSELRLKTFFYKNKKNIVNPQNFVKHHLETASLQESISKFEDAIASYDRVLTFLTSNESSISFSRRRRRNESNMMMNNEEKKQIIRCCYNRICVCYMFLYLFEERNVEVRQNSYIHASYYAKLCLECYPLEESDHSIRSTSLTNLGLLNLYMGDDLRASVFFKEVLGFPFIIKKRNSNAFHDSDDSIISLNKLVSMSNLFIAMLSRSDDVGVEILSSNLFLDHSIPNLGKNGVNSIICGIICSLACLFQQDWSNGEKNLKNAMEFGSQDNATPDFLNKFMNEISSSFVLLKK